MQIIAKTLDADPGTKEALQFIIAQQYLEMGLKIGSSGSSKVMFMDPKSLPATLEGVKAIVGDQE
jgi:regulator of protease activity HflC (stomatin/prohibitin superfamily)